MYQCFNSLLILCNCFFDFYQTIKGLRFNAEAIHLPIFNCLCVIFHKKLSITLPIFFVSELNLVPRCVLYSFLMRAKFQLCICFSRQFFANVQKKEEKEKEENEENEWFFEGSYFSNDWRDLLQIWYVVSPDMPVHVQQIWSCSD